MQPHQLPHPAANSRQVSANDVLDGKVDLQSYPNRYLVLVTNGLNGISALVAAAEWMEYYGWELVNMFSAGQRVSICYAVMRRR